MPGQEHRGRTDRASVVVDAPPLAVYAAFSDPMSLIAWLPPGQMTGRVLDYQFREGGRYRIELKHDDSTRSGAGKTTRDTDVSKGQFLSLQPGERIVQTVEFESTDSEVAGHEMVMTWVFSPELSGTRVTITAENVPTGISQADHDAGLRASLENLARFLAAANRS